MVETMGTGANLIPPDTVSVETALRLHEAGITRPMRRGDWVWHTIWEYTALVTWRESDMLMVHSSDVAFPPERSYESHVSELILLPRFTDLVEMVGQEPQVEKLAEYLIEDVAMRNAVTARFQSILKKERVQT